MKLTETMSAENAATLRVLFAKYLHDVKGMSEYDSMYTRDGVIASSAYDTIFCFMVHVHDANDKSEIVNYVLNKLERAWNARENWSNHYVETGARSHLAYFNACAVEVATLQMLVGYVTR